MLCNVRLRCRPVWLAGSAKAREQILELYPSTQETLGFLEFIQWSVTRFSGVAFSAGCDSKAVSKESGRD